MKIFELKNKAPKSPLAVSWSCVVAEKKVSGIDFDDVSDWILSNREKIAEGSLINKGADRSLIDGSGPNSLTSAYSSFNPFLSEMPGAQQLLKQILDAYIELCSRLDIPRGRTWIHSWVNVHEEGESLPPHVHNAGPYSYLSGHISIKCLETSTIYLSPINQLNNEVIYSSKNESGKLTLFQQHIPHLTSTNLAHSPRITIAFDILLDEDYRHYHSDSPAARSAVLFDEPANQALP